ncbi:hypothetical protein E3N88_11554 [Mikania micrantha]|uniref:Malectin-like domain-containing protein n=1 Tax=Mikania micrantha TaxID=192012 RepID=A0A5N6PE38_9ASTR|nr:hypothetical protein E3N88_11554 [Mikania micrantha]
MRNPKRHSLFCFLLLGYAIHAILAADYIPADDILLNCGANGQLTDDDGRQWTSDVGSKFLVPGASSIASDATIQKPSVPTVPYMTARIFRSAFTYSFPVAPGRKFVRLYFYPAVYANNLNVSKGVFSVVSGSYTLLKNFSAYETTNNLNFDYISKEYSINVDSGSVNLTFTPDPGTPDSYAFVNGIEIVSHPDIYSSNGNAMIVGTGTSFNINNDTVLENVYRLNVGGQAISPSGDTGLFRSWNGDTPYIFGAATGVSVATDSNITISYPSGMPDYVAPVDVYKTARSMGPNLEINAGYNLSWYFDVDTGFSYLVRLHFCEVAPYITKINQRVFEIFINNQTAETEADVIAWATKSDVPVIKDYVVFLALGAPRQDLWLALHPNTATKPQYLDAILNGVEIFKINTSDGNLAGTLPSPAPVQPIIDPNRGLPRKSSKSNKSGVIGGGVGGGIAAVLIVGLLVCFLTRKSKQRKDPSSSDGPSGWLPLSLYGNSHSSGSTAKTNTTGSYASSLPSNLCRHFSLADWAQHCHKKGILDQIIDPFLKGKISPECFKKVAETAVKCVADQGIERPSMGDVLWNLEFALQLQESAEESGSKGLSDLEAGVYDEVPLKGKADGGDYDGNVTDSRSTGMSMSIGGRSLASEDSDGLTPSAVFSQIMNPKGR